MSNVGSNPPVTPNPYRIEPDRPRNTNARPIHRTETIAQRRKTRLTPPNARAYKTEDRTPNPCTKRQNRHRTPL